MKRLVTQMALAMLPAMAFAQDYVVQGKEWFEVTHRVNYEKNRFDYAAERHVYRIDGDTLIGEDTWAKVYDTRYAPEEEGTTYKAAVRQQDKKVEIIPAGTEQPRLLYDFDVKLEEEVNVYPFVEDYFLRADSVHNYFEQFGMKRRVFSLHSCPWTKYHNTKDEGQVNWIEGIGTVLSGFMGRYDTEDKDPGTEQISLAACREKGQRVFQIPRVELWEDRMWSMKYDDLGTVDLLVKGDTVINGILAYNVWQRENEGEWEYNCSMAAMPGYHCYEAFVAVVDKEGVTILETNPFGPEEEYTTPEEADSVLVKEANMVRNKMRYSESGCGYTSMECYQNGELVFSVSPDNVVTSLNALRRKDFPSAIFDLQGRRMQAVPERGVFIKDGKVMVK